MTDPTIQLLDKIADSDETIVRFEGDKRYYDLTVSAKDKAAIRLVLQLYELMTDKTWIDRIWR